MDDKRFYWIKLKTDFFAENTPMDLLMGQQNGSDYVALYLKLCLMTANNGGKMSASVGEMIIPYDIDKIVRDAKYFSRDTVIVALEMFSQLGLVYRDDAGVLVIANHSDMVGSEGASAQRMRKMRDKKLSQCDNDVTPLVTGDVTHNVTHNVTDAVSQSDVRDKSIENREYIYKRESKKEKKTAAKTQHLDPISQIEKKGFSADLHEAVKDWVIYKLEKKQGYQETGLKNLLTQIENKSAQFGDAAVVALIRECMANNWQGIIWDRINDVQKKPAAKNNNRFNNFQQRNTDISDLERKLMAAQNGGA